MNSIPSGQSAWLLTAFGLDGAALADGEGVASATCEVLVVRGAVPALLASVNGGA
jgi:succinyl-CoA synthetase beta subunit